MPIVFTFSLTLFYIIVDSEDDDLNPETHKKSLEKLKKIDPDFYNFLEENDENLLNFDVESENDATDNEGEDGDTVHKPAPLQGDSDESDFEVSNKHCIVFFICFCIDVIYNL